MKNLNLKIEVDGRFIRQRKLPNDLFLNIFKGKVLAKCKNEEIANILVDAYNKSTLL